MSHISFPSVFDTAHSEPHDLSQHGAIIPLRWIVWPAVAGVAMLAVLMGVADLDLDPLAPATLAFALFFAGAGALRYRFRAPTSRRQRVVRDIADYYGLFTGIALTGAVASYPVAAMTHGFVDEGLQRADTLLRFNWLGWYHAVAAHRWLQIVGTIAYQSIFISPAVLLARFVHTGDRASAHRFLAGFGVAAMLALALFRFMPAIGPLASLVPGRLPYLPDSELYMADLIPALRLHLVHVVDLGAIRGLVSAPSFHTASAVLFVAAAWPHRVLRWPLTALNAAMLLATPVEGTHYLTDMILGALVAVVALGAVKVLVERLARRDRAAQAGSTAISVTP